MTPGFVELTCSFHFCIIAHFRWTVGNDFWGHLNPRIKNLGVPIENLIKSAENPLPFWLPDLYFEDGINTLVESEVIQIKPDGYFFW